MRSFLSWTTVIVIALSVRTGFGQTAEQIRQQLEDLQQRLEALQQREAEPQDRRATVIGTSRTRVKEENLGPSLVTQLYDLSDLFTVAQPYVAMQPSLVGPDEEVFATTAGPMSSVMGRSGQRMTGAGFGGGMGGMGGGVFSVPTTPQRIDAGTPLHQVLDQGGNTGARTTMEQLTEVIKSTIRPDEWLNKQSRIAVIGASLVVTASPETHTQIAALLDLFRQRWGSLKTLSIRAWWLWLKEDELTSAIGVPEPGAKSQVFGAIAAGPWDKLRKAAAEAGIGGYSSVVTCYNGQTVHTLAGDHRLAVTGLTPTFGIDEKSGGIAYEPSLTTLHEGAVLQITPLATRTGKYVVLDVHSRVNVLDKAAPNPARAEAIPAGDPRLVTAAIERPGLQTQRISTTLRIPVGQVTLIGGMTFGAVKDRNLYLFVAGTIQELRDDDAPANVESKAGTPAAGTKGSEKPRGKNDPKLDN